MLEPNNLPLGIVDILYGDVPVLCGPVFHPVDVPGGEPVYQSQVPEEVWPCEIVTKYILSLFSSLLTTPGWCFSPALP